MQYRDIVVGEEYGMRLKVSAAQPLHRVVVVQKVDRTKQVKLRHIEGDQDGMEEFLPFRHLVVPWKRRREFLRNEEKLAEVRRLSADFDFVTKDTVQLVLDTSGENATFVHSDGHVSMHLEPLLRIAVRAGLSPSLNDLDPHAFIDEMGRAQLSFPGVLRLARAFAAAEPDTVTMDIAASEENLAAEGYGAGERWMHDHLRTERPKFALARQWAGVEAESNRLRAEVDRLRGILGIAISDLRSAGCLREAARIDRLMNGR